MYFFFLLLNLDFIPREVGENFLSIHNQKIRLVRPYAWLKRIYSRMYCGRKFCQIVPRKMNAMGYIAARN
uniref:Putative secreted protein n=1 Tax=Anopheles darlingi TaxID=43151 RepID=A0A2M4D5W0_ANODA